MGLLTAGEVNTMERRILEPETAAPSRANLYSWDFEKEEERGRNGHSLPVNAPLSVVIRNQAFESNGHSYASTAPPPPHPPPPSNKGGHPAPLNNLLQEDFTRKVLGVVHPRHPGPSSSAAGPVSGPSASSASASASAYPHNQPYLISTLGPSAPPSSTSTVGSARTNGRQEEVVKRRSIMDKLERLRKAERLDVFVPQMDPSTTSMSAISMCVRRYQKQHALPKRMMAVLSDEAGPSTGRERDAAGRGAGIQAANKRGAGAPADPRDGEETDYSDLEEAKEKGSCPSAPTTSSACGEWAHARLKYAQHDHLLMVEEDECNEEMRILEATLAEMERLDAEQRPYGKGGTRRRKREGEDGGEEEDEGCARLIEWSSKYRRKITRRAKETTNRVEEEGGGGGRGCMYGGLPWTKLAEQYLARAANLPVFALRKRRGKATWLNSKELNEEKTRNLTKKKEEREKREKRKAEQVEEAEKSDSYEETDEDEDDGEYLPQSGATRRDRVNSTSSAAARKKRKRERKARKQREGANPPMPLSKIGRRPSAASQALLRPSFDDIPAFDLSVITTPIEYKEISTPSWRRTEADAPDGAEAKEDAAHYSTEAMMRRIAEAHHPREYEEKSRFHAVPQSSRGGNSQRSHNNSASGAKFSCDVPFDYGKVAPNPCYERLSKIPPYPPRKFKA